MAKKLVETVYGKHNKFEIYKDEGLFSNSYIVRKDGKYLASYSALNKAVEAAKKAGKVY